MTPGKDSSDARQRSPQDVATEELAEHVADLETITARLQARLDDHEARWTELSELAAQLDSATHDRPEPAEPDRQPTEPGPGQLPLFGPTPAQPLPRSSRPLPGAAGPEAGHPGAAPPNPGSTAQSSSSGASSPSDAKAPTFIVLFDADSDEERQEILALDEWVTQVLVPTYVTYVSSRQPWCAQWWDHPEALARIHALWLAWQELTDETAGGHTGPSLWHRDHLDDTMARLRSHDGPFGACMIDPQTPSHRRNRKIPVEPYRSSHARTAASPSEPTCVNQGVSS